MQDAELSWNKLEEQVYTVEKRQEINLGSKFMPWEISAFQEKKSVLIDIEVVHIHVALETRVSGTRRSL